MINLIFFDFFDVVFEFSWEGIGIVYCSIVVEFGVIDYFVFFLDLCSNLFWVIGNCVVFVLFENLIVFGVLRVCSYGVWLWILLGF